MEQTSVAGEVQPEKKVAFTNRKYTNEEKIKNDMGIYVDIFKIKNQNLLNSLKVLKDNLKMPLSKKLNFLSQMKI